MRMKQFLLSAGLWISCVTVATASVDTTTTPLSAVREAHGIVYVSGQLGIASKANPAPQTEKLSFEAEARNAIENVRFVLKTEKGLALDDVINVTVYLADINNYELLNTIYAEYFEDPYPARAVVEVAQLPRGGQLEVAVVAATESK